MASILVVQEDPFHLELLSHLIQHHKPGYTVYAATEAADALTVLEIHRVDLLITELELPGMDGIELLNRARDFLPRPASIVLGEDEEHYRTVAHLAGAARFFEKPVDADPFCAEIDFLLERNATKPLLGVTVANLLQMLEGYGSDSMLTVVSESRKGQYYFQGGRVVHAVAPPEEGLDAAYGMLAWEVHLFHTAPLSAPVEPTLNQTVMGLLLAAAVHADERNGENT